MLSIGESHSMGLNRVFRGGDYNFGASPQECVTASLESGQGVNVLQQQLNDLVHNSYLHQGFSQQCAPLVAEVDSHLVPNSYGGYPFMGFSQTDIERSLMYDIDLAPIADNGVPYPNLAVSKGPPASFTPLAGLELSTPHSIRPAVTLAPQVPRERWGEARPLSPRGLKRGSDTLDTCKVLRKKVEKNITNADPKWKRPTEQAEHIIRERQRRDDMTHKFSILESLLPTGAKRDRSTIVDDSIEYVKNLHHRIKELHQRKMEMKEAVTGALSPQTQRTASAQRGVRLTSAKGQVELAQVANDAAGQPKEGVHKIPASKEELYKFHVLLESCVEKVDVHADLPHQIFVEMVCRPFPHLQSQILQCFECLRLNVTQCSITKLGQHVICVISAELREVASHIASTCDIVATLKYALGASQQLTIDEKDPGT